MNLASKRVRARLVRDYAKRRGITQEQVRAVFDPDMWGGRGELTLFDTTS